MDVETARSILVEMDRLAREELAASYVDGDRNPPVFDPETNTAPVPETFKKSLRGLHGLRVLAPGPARGDRRHQRARAPCGGRYAELVLGSNPADLDVLLRPVLRAHRCTARAPTSRRRWAKLFVEKQWGSTMVLTEPDAGSDVGAGRTRAIPQPDGSWHIEGVKRFITSGEHDLSDNIIHYVLARRSASRASAARAPRACRCSWCRSSTSTPRPASWASATASSPPTSSTRWA